MIGRPSKMPTAPGSISGWESARVAGGRVFGSTPSSLGSSLGCAGVVVVAVWEVAAGAGVDDD